MYITQQEIYNYKNCDSAEATATPFPTGSACYYCFKKTIHNYILGSTQENYAILDKRKK